jgi:hypothetical protein
MFPLCSIFRFSRRVLVVNLGLPYSLLIKLGDCVSEFRKIGSTFGCTGNR